MRVAEQGHAVQARHTAAGTTQNSASQSTVTTPASKSTETM